MSQPTGHVSFSFPFHVSYVCLIDLYWEKVLVYGVIGVDKVLFMLVCLDFLLFFFLLLASPIWVIWAFGFVDFHSARQTGGEYTSLQG